MIGNARGSHSSPGIYMKEVDLSYASKSLGITTLGVVGETLKGPAFEPIRIENWNEFVNYFGGTSTELFKGTKYPKYELPYIAKTYLKNSKQLEVCRVLGLSGYNAGPAWLITASKGESKYVEVELQTGVKYSPKESVPTTNEGDYIIVGDKHYKWDEVEGDDRYVVAVLRSRGTYGGYNLENSDICTGSTEYDKLNYAVSSVGMEKYSSATLTLECGSDVVVENEDEEYELSPGKYGKFTLVVNNTKYPVSLNPSDSDYIIKKLGTTPEDGDAPIFVEELYDVAFMSMVDKGELTTINGEIKKLDEGIDDENNPIQPSYDAVYDIKDDNLELTTSHVGLTFLTEEGEIEKVVMQREGNLKIYTYESTGNQLKEDEYVYVQSKECYYKCITNDEGVKSVTECNTDINDYKEQYRCASTPWIVSELKGDGKTVDVKTLFRFHTISDGAAANTEVKISIQNIRPDEGLFDVLVRKFDDEDGSPVILEKFGKCSMVPGTNNYIGLKIGTFDGEYMTKSKYVTVEINKSEVVESCVPAGFLGYPMRKYEEGFLNPDMGYYTLYNDDENAKKQYFGFSNLKGIDVDLFKYKGRNAYNNKTLSKGFHLDSRITAFSTKDGFTIMVDGEKGFEFQTVDAVSYGKGHERIGSEYEMEGTIYENVNLRKFTVCFYGGFDGWDPYRTERTNTDKFKANKYKGTIINGVGRNFSPINDPKSLGLNGKTITSDYYAYLAAARQFDNIEAVDINVFATPGIDYVNQPMLSREILSMIEEERGDALYVMTTPDMDGNDNMIYPEEAVFNLEDAEIDSNYAATYYPWVKYFDADNNQYIDLPATKDALAAMAYTDNVSYPWFAPAGTVRGNVECAKARYITKIDDEDTLYEGRINPIKTFAVDGVKIWGQKTMYGEETPLNRINVRRLMLRIKKLISGACRRLIFEQNDTTVKAQFEGLVRPILDDIKTKRGIYDYRLQIDDSPEARDRQELPASILIKPTKALEYIDIVFTIMPESVSFDE